MTDEDKKKGMYTAILTSVVSTVIGAMVVGFTSFFVKSYLESQAREFNRMSQSIDKNTTAVIRAVKRSDINDERQDGQLVEHQRSIDNHEYRIEQLEGEK